MRTVRRRKRKHIVPLAVVAAAMAGQLVFAISIEDAGDGLIARGAAAVRQAVLQRTLQGGWPIAYSSGNI